MVTLMKCSNCGKEVNKGWEFCPHCGNDLAATRDSGIFGDVFSLMGDPFKRMNKMFLPSFGLSTDIDKMEKEMLKEEKKAAKRQEQVVPLNRGGGFSISISSAGGAPRIDVKTFGDCKDMEPELKRQLGVRENAEAKEQKTERSAAQKEKQLVMPDKKVEPDGNIEPYGQGGYIIRVTLPDVKESDIRVTRMGESLEIRAASKDVGYFKLFNVPARAKPVASKFEKGVLMITLR